MDTLSYKTRSAKKEDLLKKEWYLIDAENEILGRLATQVALLLRGKTKTIYTPNLDCGDYVVIINAEKIRLTGNKLTDKEYISHTGYPGGQRKATPAELLKKRPEAIIEKAVKGMLPRNRLGRELFRNLHVYAGAEHPHEAQKPKAIKVNSIR
jgi:large subunit ribosomal protein L13